MRLGISCNTKYKSSPKHKAVYNYTIYYFIALIINGFEVLNNPKNDQINLWSECNSIILNKIMINI